MNHSGVSQKDDESFEVASIEYDYVFYLTAR